MVNDLKKEIMKGVDTNNEGLTNQEKTCKNCNEIVTGNFCANCGQKTSVHRYSFKHFIEHDLVHGIWHIDKGILFTIKELLTRPGHSIREFINGKRVGYFNVITLLIIIAGLLLFAGKYSDVSFVDITSENLNTVENLIQHFSENHPKEALLLTIPFYTIFSFLWFRKAKLNLSEHFILNAYKTVAELIITLFFTLVTIFYTNPTGLMLIYVLASLSYLVYTFWYYKQFFSDYGYSKRSLIIRSLGATISYQIVVFVFGITFTAIHSLI